MAADIAEILVGYLRRGKGQADRSRISMFFGNTLYLVAFGYWTVISFLGYNGGFFLSLLGEANEDSVALPPPHGAFALAIARLRHFLAREPVRVQHTTHFCRSLKIGKRSMTGGICFLSPLIVRVSKVFGVAVYT